MSNSPVYKLLKEAVTALTEYRIDDVSKMLDKPYQQAIRAETDPEIKEKAAALWSDLKTAISDPVKDRLDMKKVHDSVLSKFKESSPIPPKNQIGIASELLHNALHKVSTHRLQQAEALTIHEKDRLESFSTDGWVGKVTGAAKYNIDVMKRRWDGDYLAGATSKEIDLGIADDTITNISEPPTPPPAPQSGTSMGGKGMADSILNKGGFNSFDGIKDIPKKSHTPPAPQKTKLDEKALEEFGGVDILDKPWKKARALAIGALGTGLVVHGARNMYLSFNPDTDTHLELNEKQTEQKGINWTRLAVGTAEAIAGSAIIYRAAVGKWTLGAVEGKADALLNCDHGAQR